jgi:hypothetical protein
MAIRSIEVVGFAMGASRCLAGGDDETTILRDWLVLYENLNLKYQ